MALRRAGATGSNLDWRLLAAGAWLLVAGPATQLTCSLTGQAKKGVLFSSPRSTVSRGRLVER